MHHYWNLDEEAKTVECPWCNANSMQECITNKDVPHSLGYVHRDRSRYYLETLSDMILYMETKEKEIVI